MVKLHLLAYLASPLISQKRCSAGVMRGEGSHVQDAVFKDQKIALIFLGVGLHLLDGIEFAWQSWPRHVIMKLYIRQYSTILLNGTLLSS